MALTYAFNAVEGETPEDVKRKRAIVEALMGQTGPARNVGEGIAALGAGIAAGMMRRRTDKAEKASLAAADERWNKAMPVFPSAPAAPGQSAPAAVSGGSAASTPGADLAAYLTTGKDKSHLQFADDFNQRMGKFLAAAPGGGIKINSGYRSPERQAELYAAAVKKYGSPEAARKWVAPPGRSNHNHGTAADIGYASPEVQKWAHENAAKYGLHFRMGHEPWHVEPIKGWQGDDQLQGSVGADPIAAANVPPTDAGIQAPGGQRIVQTLLSPKPMGGAPQTMQPADTPERRIAQAVTGQAPEMAGNVMADTSGPSMQQLMQLAGDPWLSEGRRGIVGALLEGQFKRQQEQADPKYQLGLEADRLGLDKARLEIDALRNPKQSFRPLVDPEERARYGIRPDDTRPYQVGADGKLDAVGGTGQTINVGGEVDARKAAADQMGLSPDDPRYQSFVLTGKFPREDAQALTATDKKAILEADEMVSAAEGALPILSQALALNSKAYEGPLAGARGYVTSVFGSDAGEATLEYDNLVQQQALSQLKAIFGAAPTEGERKILLDIAGSSSLPAEVRKGVLERAQQAVQRRLAMYKGRADELRGGTFYKSDRPQGANPQAAPSGAADDPLGLF